MKNFHKTKHNTFDNAGYILSRWCECVVNKENDYGNKMGSSGEKNLSKIWCKIWNTDCKDPTRN